MQPGCCQLATELQNRNREAIERFDDLIDRSFASRFTPTVDVGMLEAPVLRIVTSRADAPPWKAFSLGSVRSTARPDAFARS
jgi:hypothetical protein